MNRARSLSGRVAAIVLAAYGAMLVQPCAVAMQMLPEGSHPAGCNGAPHQHEETLCLVQPAADCVAGDWSTDGRDTARTQFDLPFAGPTVYFVAAPDHRGAVKGAYCERPPPRGAPTLTLSFCVFLK